MADELRLSIEKLIYGGDGLAHSDGNTVFVPYVLPGEEVRANAKTKRRNWSGPNSWRSLHRRKKRGQAKMRSFSEMRRLPLPAHSGNGAVEAQERHFARNAFAARRNHVEWRDGGTFSGTVRLSKPRAMGGAKPGCAGAGILPAGEFGNCADR